MYIVHKKSHRLIGQKIHKKVEHTVVKGLELHGTNDIFHLDLLQLESLMLTGCVTSLRREIQEAILTNLDTGHWCS